MRETPRIGLRHRLMPESDACVELELQNFIYQDRSLDMRRTIAPGPTVHWLFRSHDLPSKFSAIASRIIVADKLGSEGHV